MTSVVALHGFLGLARDWDFAKCEFPGLRAHDLWADVSSDFNAFHSFNFWAQKFTAGVEGRPLLIGYSMGGRLAMHAALLEPRKFSGAIFISAHPGLGDPGERAKRITADQVWAERFASEPWAETVAKWNAQTVLQSPSGVSPLERREQDFERAAVCLAMNQWSLGRQADLRANLAGLELPVLFLSGASDTKFTSLLQELQLSPQQKHLVIPNAGHRLPWDQPQEFVKAVKEFQRNL